MTKSDYGVTIGSTNYDKYWIDLQIHEVFASPATFQLTMQATGPSDFSTIAVGADFKLYSYDAAGTATLRFLGIINSAKRISFNQLQISGYDYGGKLINSAVASLAVASMASFESGNQDTLGTIVNKLCSQNLDGSAPWVITVGTVDSSTNEIGKFKVPMLTRWDALSMLAKRANMELYVDPVAGTVQLRASRGTSVSQKTYNMTGTGTNAYSSSHEFTNNNIWNDIISYGAGKDLSTRYQDNSTTFCKTTVSDTRTTAPLSSLAGSVTLNVVSTTGWPATGRVIVKGVPMAFAASANTYFDYTSKTATSITGSFGLPMPKAIPTNTPILLTNVIVVDNNSSFPSSGSIVIGEEMIDYSAKPSSTTFTVSQVVNYARRAIHICSINGDQTSTATTITVDSTTGFPASGSIAISVVGSSPEIVSYTGVGATTFTGCMRGVNGSKPLALPNGTGVSLYGSDTIHPAGVLVYKYVATPDANSSIGQKGRKTYTLRLESASTIEDLEAQTSRFLEIHKWGDQNAVLKVPTVFDYYAVSLGDKITLNDSTLNWSSYEVRVVEKTLTLQRSSGMYELEYVVGTYSDNPREGNLSQDMRDLLLRMTGAKEGTVAVANSDADTTNVGNNRPSGGVNFGFQPPSGTGIFSNENKMGYVFSNNVWIDGSSGTTYWGTPFVCYSVGITTTSGISLGGSEGVAGQALLSGGPGAAATWGTAGNTYWSRNSGTGFLYPTTTSDNIGDSTSFISQIYAVDLLSSTLNLYYSGLSHYTLGLTSATAVEMPIRNLTIGDKAACKLVLSGTDNNSIYKTYIYPNSSNANADVYIYALGTGTVKFYATGSGSAQTAMDFYPSTDVTYNCGTAGYQWLGVYTQKLICATGASARLRLPVGTNMYG